MASAQVLARELASPALLAPGQLQKSDESIPGGAPVVPGRPTPTFPATLLNRPNVWTIAPAGCPDQ
jgi:hypothetical protein